MDEKKEDGVAVGLVLNREKERKGEDALKREDARRR